MQADKAAAQVVVNLIDTLPETVNSDHAGLVATVRTAFDSLTDDQKTYVTNLDRLVAAEEQLKAQPPVEIIYGDVDGDGKVTAADALEVLKSVVGKVTLTDDQLTKADVDGSGKIDAADALDILKKVVGKIEKFAVEE